MQSRQLRILNVALALCALALIWRLNTQWHSEREHPARLTPGSGAASLFVPPSSIPVQTVSADQVVAKNIFMPDRSSEKPQAAQTPAPPLPVVFGTMRLGEGFEALMAEAGQSDSRRAHRVKSGENFGGYTVAEITDETVVVEFGGQKTTVNVYQSANATRNTAPAPATPTVAASPNVESTASAVASTPGNTFAPGSSATSAPGPAAAANTNTQLPPDLKVTIEGNRKRFERTTPFGPQVWYEEIPK